jgi:16S rRNA (cytidine1402-2'-O)-methyltransferase
MPRDKGAGAGRRARTSGGLSGAVSLAAGAIGPEPIEAVQPSKLAPGLYVVATPIGNLGDITLRALKILAGSSAVLCEDTRVTGKLLARFGIAARKIPYHDHNAERARPGILRRLKAGEALALVSDAGTPLVSDPGYKLVRDAIAEGIAVTAIPGASAALNALVLSGLPPDVFLFGGFLPAKSAARKRSLQEWKSVRATLLFYETAPRLADSLADMAEVLGDRPASVSRELTKLYEEVKRGTLAGLAAFYREAGAPRGEVVVAVGPPAGPASDTGGPGLDRALEKALAGASLRQAVADVAAATGLPRRLVYARALYLKGERR